jgi:hypothetical protein
MKDLSVIKSLLTQQKASLLDRYNISEVGIFGSYVRGEQKEASDLDVLVEFFTPPSLFGFMDIEDELSNKLGVKVDLVRKKSLKSLIGKQILNEVEYL